MRLTSRNLMLAASVQALALAALPLPGLGTAAFAADAVVPPPVSHARAEYFKSHPEQWNAIMANAPTARMVPPRPASAEPATPGTWSPLVNPAPASGLGNPLLLTDGSVIVHVLCSPTWYKLSPDSAGSYIAGTWSQIANAPWQPLYFASQILNDGRVVGNGGEYTSNGSGGCSAVWMTGGGIYNPGNNTWVNLPPPPGWTTIGDAQSIILSNTKYMLADCCTTNQAILNPATLAWTATGSGKFDVNDEEGWALLHDGRVLTTDAYVFTGTCGVGAERYTPSTGAWTAAGTATTQLSDCLAGGNRSFEVGPVVVRPGGSAVAFSGVTTGVAGTSIYNPGTNSWSAGPNLPTIAGQNYNLADAPAVSLPDGNILFAASPGKFLPPVHVFEFNSANAIVQRADPPNAPGEPSFVVNFLMLPTGQVLQTDFTNDVEIYTPFGVAPVSSKPVVSSVPTTLTRGTTYSISALRGTGITHGVYGDDQQAATNFPLVQLESKATNKIYYARTSYFSTRSDSPSATVTAMFKVPAPGLIPIGTFNLRTIANGIASDPVVVTVN